MRAATPAIIVLVIAALLGGCSGSGTDSAPDQQGQWAYLYQQSPGDEASIRLRLEQPDIPLEEQIFAWLFFRAEGRQYFSLSADRLVDVWFESRLPGGKWDDGPAAMLTSDVERDFMWINSQGEEDTVTTHFVYTDPALQAGRKYYHRVQRVVEPMERPGGGGLVTAGALQPAQTTPLIDVDPSGALSQGSSPTAGVTYFTPPVLQDPADGARDRQTNQLTFRWTATVGANEYVVQVFPSDDANGERNPRYQETLRQDFSGTISHSFEDDLAPGTQFHWRVGARRAGEALPVNAQLGQAGWLFSEMRTFATAQSPPSPP